MFKNDLFEGKRFLITGGGTGLGKIMLDRSSNWVQTL